MKTDLPSINQIAACTERLLKPLGNRWLHVQGVVERAHQVSQALDATDGIYLLAAAYLHDIGYAPELKNTGFHPLDGAYYVHSLGYDRVASLVAYHSEARFEARLRGYERALSTFSCEHSVVADALTYCDQTTGPAGAHVSLEKRIAEVYARYGETVVSQALRQSQPYLAIAVTRTQQRLRLYGVNIDS